MRRENSNTFFTGPLTFRCLPGHSAITLIEILVAAGIACILLATLWNLFRFAGISLMRGKQKTDLAGEFRLISSYMRDDFENATEIKILEPSHVKLTRIHDFDRAGRYGLQEIVYACENGLISRKTGDGKKILLGDRENLSLGFEATLDYKKTDSFDRYEVKIRLAGISFKSERSDEITIVICPPMMALNRQKNWNPVPGQ